MFIFVVIISCILFLYHFRWRKNKNPASITNWPIVGMYPSILSNVHRVHDYATDVLTNYENLTLGVKGPWFTNLDFIFTSAPENVHCILSTNYANFQRGKSFKKIFDVFGDGIIIAESESWKVQRKLIHTLFKDRNFLLFLEKTVQEKVENSLFPILDRVIEQESEVDMQDLLHRFTFDVTCIFLFGFDSKSLAKELPEVQLLTAIDEFEEGSFQRNFVPESIWKLQEWLHIGEARKVQLARKTFDDFLYHHIPLKREQVKREAETNVGCDLVTQFIKEEDNIEAITMSDDFLRDSVVNLVVAGRDTTGLTLSWFFWLVSINPDVENKIREEIKEYLHIKEGEKWSFYPYEKVNKLVYLHAALCETLRLYPPIPFFLKAAVKPDVLPSGHYVDKDTNIVSAVYAMGRMKKIWGDDCAEFKPERWISEQGEIVHFPSYKFVAFGAGPRTCVGKDLAFIEMKITASAVLWNYHLQIVEGRPIVPSSSVVLRMKHGLKVKVMKRYG